MANETEGVIYHYCSMEALLGIVQSRTIWMTNIFYLNDDEEHYHLRRMVLSLLEEEGEELSKWAERLTHYFDLLKEKVRPEGITNVYCTCFSEDWDSLSQWRAYADDGRGVAIGFDREYFSQLVAKMPNALEMANVTYDQEEQYRIVEAILGVQPNAGEIVVEKGTDLPRLFAEFLAQATAAQISRAAARCKTRAFREEREVRVIYHGPLPPEIAEDVGPLKVRASQGLLIPYHALRLDPEAKPCPIREVAFGPRNMMHLNVDSLSVLLGSAGFALEGIGLRKSEASYR